jgi:phage minor structural protein
MVGIEKDEDPTEIITRLYPLGYGEGVNQLTISSVNNGVPYIDADTIGT